MADRVIWKHDCPMPDRCGYDRGGEVWIAKGSLTEAFSLSPYEVAKGLGLTADHAPDPSRPHVMVAWDCRPGALQVHYWDELEVMREVPDSPEERRQFIPDDPTKDPDFDPTKWTGTILSGLISTRTECGVCGQEWHDGPCAAAGLGQPQ